MKHRSGNGMEGRYGVDQLNRFLLYLSMALLVVSFFVRSMILSLVITALIVWALFRMLSRNYEARRAENDRFMNMGRSIKGFFTGGMRSVKDPDHAYFRCPNCHQLVRVPKGKGHIQITCPKCHTQFIKET